MLIILDIDRLLDVDTLMVDDVGADDDQQPPVEKAEEKDR
jgi:hypothetical protein